MRINCGLASIPLFRIDILPSSESVQFGAKMTRTEPDDKIELRKVLRPLHLPLGQHLGSRKILKVFMICNNVNGIGQTYQVVSPNLKSFKDGKQFLVIYIIIQLCYHESVGVKSNQINFIFFVNNWNNCSESIVWSISFHNELSIRNPISENESGSECFFERIKSIMIGEVKIPRNVFLGETCQ